MRTDTERLDAPPSPCRPTGALPPVGRRPIRAAAQVALAGGPIARHHAVVLLPLRRVRVRGGRQTPRARPPLAEVLVTGTLVGARRLPARVIHDAAAAEGVLLRGPFRLPAILLLLQIAEA